MRIFLAMALAAGLFVAAGCSCNPCEKPVTCDPCKAPAPVVVAAPAPAVCNPCAGL